jgi:hypothetical protein
MQRLHKGMRRPQTESSGFAGRIAGSNGGKTRQSPQKFGSMRPAAPRLAILHSRSTPPGAPHHIVSEIAAHLEKRGIRIVQLYGPDRFEPADAVFMHVDLSVVPQRYLDLAARYPLQINARARDIRKSVSADGLVGRDSRYDGPVIVKSDLNYGGVPEYKERALPQRIASRVRKIVDPRAASTLLTKHDYRIYPSLAEVPMAAFRGDNVVQKLVTEQAGGKNVLREYYFLGDLHYQSIEQSAATIITEDEHQGCEPFAPPARLISLRERLSLDYGKIDFVMADGEPFVFDVNKTMGLGAWSRTDLYGPGLRAMIKAFAGEIDQALRAPEASALWLKPETGHRSGS